jgi:dCTP deaminase
MTDRLAGCIARRYIARAARCAVHGVGASALPASGAGAAIAAPDGRDRAARALPTSFAPALHSMSIQNDRWITQMAKEHGMIEPFEDRQVRQGVISYGVSSYGYDMRVAREFRIFTNVLNSVVDPKAFDPKSFVEWEGDVCIVPPNSFALARSVEYFRIPRDVVTICVGKSTYARCGIITNVTPFEPEWEGFVTLEISNTTPLPARIYANEGIAQVLFFRGEEPPQVSYKDKKGKYQGQTGVTLPKL